MKTELLDKMLKAGVFRRPFQASHGKVFVDHSCLCGDISLVSDAGEVMGLEISDATSDGRRLPLPDLLIATGIRSVILAQWVINSMRTSGLGEIGFKWCEYNKGTGHDCLEPHYGAIQPGGKKALVITIELGSGDRTREAIFVAGRENAEIIGVATLFNRWGLAADQIGVPCLISTFSEEDLLRAAKDFVIDKPLTETVTG